MTRGVVAVPYVLTVTVLTGSAFSDAEQAHWGAEIAAAVLGLPCLLPALPVIYIVGALAWHGPTWVVTPTFMAMMAAVAVANVLLVRAAASALSRTRWGAARRRAPRGPSAATRPRRG